MGLLDDAIKEHLELKRRHGADPNEVARQEREALGPARRPAAEPSEAAEDAAGGADRYEPEPEPAPQGEDAPFAGEAPEHAEPVDRDPAAPGHAEPEDADPGRPGEEPALYEPLPEPEAQAAPSADPPSDTDSPRRDGQDGDVLEETPEFLEETPEHDRLWFEQRPPRDFDFDD